jgi:membrane-bound metal-dependent hydrolase YbcI (DUF457 family)
MDTITHAFAGALLGKGLFSTRRSETPTEFSSQARVAIFAATIGSAFPDIDVLYDIVSRDSLAMLKYHRYITHSLILLPLWAVALAWLINWGARRLGLAPPSFGWTALAAAVGIASHLLLDVTTSFGTMIWSPFSRARPAWDVIFIIDFTMTAILLVPQIASWVFRDAKQSVRRASRMWALFTLLALVVSGVANATGFPFSLWVVPAASAIFALVFFLPLRGGWGLKIRRSTWARAGLLVAGAYLLLCTGAHYVALKRLRAFAANQNIAVRELGALPLAPSPLVWDGLIRTDNGVYRLHQNLLSTKSIEYDFYPDSPPGKLLDAVMKLPETETYLWFARFPVFRNQRVEGNPAIEIMDMRFVMNNRRAPGFTFRVTFDSAGNVIQQGIVKDPR